MKNILFITHLKNTRYTHGGQVYRESIANLLRNIYQGVEISEIFFSCQRQRHTRKLLQVRDLFCSVFSSLPAKVLHFKSNSFKYRLLDLFRRQQFDAVFIHGAEMLWCLDLLPSGMPVVAVAHNVEYLLYEQQVERYANLPLFGRLLARDQRKLKKFELEQLSQSKKIITTSPLDEKVLSILKPKVSIKTIYPAFTYAPHDRQRRKSSEKIILGFLANMEWWPNQRSINWFLQEVLPSVGDRYQVHLFGQNSKSFHGSKHVIGHGFLDDLSAMWQKVDLMIQPIVHGSGINIKVAECIYNRCPLVATPHALRGLSLQSDPAIVELDGVDAWIEYLWSDKVEQLIICEVREENAELFVVSRNAKLLKEFLDPLAETST